MKILSKNLFFLFILFFTSTNLSIAQPGALASTRTEGEAQDCGQLMAVACNFNRTYDIYLTNLVETSPGVFNIDNSLPEMFLEHSFDYGQAQPTITPLIDFTFVKYINTIPVYKKSIQTNSINIESACDDTEGEVFYLRSDLRLVTQGDQVGEYIEYPACQYNNPDEIFSCNVFYFAGHCSNSSQGDEDNDTILGFNDDDTVSEEEGGQGFCQNDRLTRNDYCYILPCEGCLSLGGNLIINDDIDINPTSEEIIANPNPFNNNFKIQLPTNSKIEYLSLYNINGQLVKSWNKNQLESNSSIKVDMHDFMNGVYLLKVKSPDNSKVIKLIKQE